jgi:hypothetical protein
LTRYLFARTVLLKAFITSDASIDLNKVLYQGGVYMKKKLLVLLLAAAMSICAACSGNSVEKTLQSSTWQDVNDGDTYTFVADGTGKHGENDITYVIDEQVVSITEGTGSAEIKYTFDNSGDISKLTREDGSSYLVPSENYEEIANQIREENVKILTTTEMWAATKTTAYQQFLNDGDGKSGSGWTVTPVGTLGMSWKMKDNNTVVCELPGGTATYTIVNNGGSYSLVDDAGNTLFVPK